MMYECIYGIKINKNAKRIAYGHQPLKPSVPLLLSTLTKLERDGERARETVNVEHLFILVEG